MPQQQSSLMFFMRLPYATKISGPTLQRFINFGFILHLDFSAVKSKNFYMSFFRKNFKFDDLHKLWVYL